MNLKKRILIAPLNWGLGHATRCIPIINALIRFNFEPIIASDGDSLMLLKKEFPKLVFIELPSYNINYSKKAFLFKWTLFLQLPKIIKVINAEHKQVDSIIETYSIDGLISDNRFGVYSKKTPSVYITHQLAILSGNSTWLSSRIHQKRIKKFDKCWIPDSEFAPNLSGNLGHIKNPHLALKYIGALSRFKKAETKIKYDLLVLLSGPEPQRTLLEEKLFNELSNFDGEILFVKGRLEVNQKIEQINKMTVYNYMESEELEQAINESKLIVSRSGYTTIMDLAKLEKKAFFIPTPGQFEQNYLAKRLDNLQIAPFCKQDDFKIKLLEKIADYKGFSEIKEEANFKELFSLF